MKLGFEPFVAPHAGLLARFLSASDWPFHYQQRVDASWVRGRLEIADFPVNGGEPVDTVGYAILRDEAEAP
jgi:hypothetical protein